VPVCPSHSLFLKKKNMTELLQAIADGLFTFLLVFETFLDTIDNINFLDSGYSLLVLFYSIALINFIVNLFNDFIIGDAYDQQDTVDLEEDDDIINVLGEGTND
jgi:hypothetical protein